MYLAKYRTAVFVHGCFWHRHPGCKYAYIPKSRVEFWQDKFEANIRRDATVSKELCIAKVKQLVVWECTIRRMMKDKAIEQSVITSIISFLEGVEDFTEI